MNIGDYVRTKWGIARLTDITTYPCNPFKDEIEEGDATLTVYYIDTCFIPIDETRIWKEDIIKSSPNIIDLIEVGDYVNGYKVSFKDFDIEPFVQCDYPVQYGSTNHYRFNEKGIKSIVTKEQFANMKYTV